MERCPRSWLPVLLVLLCTSPGCLLTHHTTHVVREKEPRHEVRFESEEAEATFNARATAKDAPEKKGRFKLFAVPFLLWYSREDVLSENAWYNDQIVACDADRDGLITLREARAYNPKYVEEAAKLAESKPAAASTASAESKPGQDPPNRSVQPASLQQPFDAPLPEPTPGRR